MHGYIQVVRAKNRNISVRQEKLQKERTMGNARKPTRKGRYILRAATFVVLSFSFAARISGEPVGQSAKPSNGLVAFADAPDQRAGCAGDTICADLHDHTGWWKQKAAHDGEAGKFLSCMVTKWRTVGIHFYTKSQARNLDYRFQRKERTAHNIRFITCLVSRWEATRHHETTSGGATPDMDNRC